MRTENSSGSESASLSVQICERSVVYSGRITDHRSGFRYVLQGIEGECVAWCVSWAPEKRAVLRTLLQAADGTVVFDAANSACEHTIRIAHTCMMDGPLSLYIKPIAVPGDAFLCQCQVESAADTAHTQRRIAAILVVDCSKTMSPEDMTCARDAIATVLHESTGEPTLLEQLYLSCVSFDQDVIIHQELTDLASFVPPVLNENRFREGNIGSAISAVRLFCDESLRRTDALRKGDYRPLIAVFSNFQCREGWELVAALRKGCGWLRNGLVACCMGENIDHAMARHLTDKQLMWPDPSASSTTDFVPRFHGFLRTLYDVDGEIECHSVPVQDGVRSSSGSLFGDEVASDIARWRGGFPWGPGGGCVPPEDFRHKLESEEVEQITDDSFFDVDISFGFFQVCWSSLKPLLRAEDEIWEWSSSPESWAELCGCGGICIVRNGEAIASMLTRMN